MKNVKDIDDKKKAQSLKESQALISNANEIAEPGIIQKLLDLWEDCVIKHYDDNDCAALLPLTGKQVGTLNLIVKQLKANWASGHDHSAQWPDVIAWVLSNWDEFEKKCPKWAELPGLPEVEFLDAHLDVAVKIWLTAGQPVYKPKDPKPASGKPPTRPWIEH